MYFTLNGFEAECHVWWRITLEGDGIRGRDLRGGPGSFGNGRWVGCHPGIDAMLQATAAAIVWDGLTVWKVYASVLAHSTAGVDVVDCARAAADHVAGLCAKGATVRARLLAEERPGF
jgi:hypothetical protein